MRLDDRTAIVTGSTQGIGRAIAERFAEEGASVVVNARAEAAVKETGKAIEAAGGTAVGYSCDVTDRAAVEAMVGRRPRSSDPATSW